MKILEILESFDPLPGTPDTDGRTIASWIYAYEMGDQYITKLLQQKIVVQIHIPWQGKWYKMDFWNKNYGIADTPENQQHIQRVKKIHQQQVEALKHILSAPISDKIDKTKLEEMSKFLETKSGELRADAEYIYDRYPKGIDPEHGLEDSGYFVSGDLYGRAGRHIKERLFLVYHQDDIVRYADVADRDAEIVKMLMLLNKQLNEIKVQYQALLRILYPGFAQYNQ